MRANKHLNDLSLQKIWEKLQIATRYSIVVTDKLPENPKQDTFYYIEEETSVTSENE